MVRASAPSALGWRGQRRSLRAAAQIAAPPQNLAAVPAASPVPPARAPASPTPLDDFELVVEVFPVRARDDISEIAADI